jgi:hypothetical protein
MECVMASVGAMAKLSSSSWVKTEGISRSWLPQKLEREEEYCEIRLNYILKQ